jgi:hypothetical protein
MTDRAPLTSFETALLRELRGHVATRAAAQQAGPVERHRRLAWGTGAAGAATAVAVGVFALGSTPAYSVEQQSDGDVVVSIRSLDDADGLEKALAAKGVEADVKYLAKAQAPPAKSATGKQRMFTERRSAEGPSTTSSGGRGDEGPSLTRKPAGASDDGHGCSIKVQKAADRITFTLPAKAVDSDAVLHITTAGNFDTRSSIGVRWDDARVC